MTRDNDFRGNKKSLDAKICATCGRTMTWRLRWAKSWDAVRYCSESCRRNKAKSVAQGSEGKP